MSLPKHINPAFRAPKSVVKNLVETVQYFGHKQLFGAVPVIGFTCLLLSGIWLNNLRYQNNNYHSMKADGSALAGGGH